jgi:hypothetical protein
VAAAELERAWYFWRAAHGPVTDPMPTVSSYVGYSLEEPWGEPRVVLGIAAQDAEQLAGLLVRPDHAGPARLSPHGADDEDGPVFREIIAARLHAAGEAGLVGDLQPVFEPVTTALFDVVMPDATPADTWTIDAVPLDDTETDMTDVFVTDCARMAAAEFADPEPAPADYGSPGPWAMAESAARAEAEARIKARLHPAEVAAGDQAPPADPSRAELALVAGFVRLDGAHQAAGTEHSASDDADSDVTRASEQPDAAPGAHGRRGRIARGYPIPKLSRAKR